MFVLGHILTVAVSHCLRYTVAWILWQYLSLCLLQLLRRRVLTIYLSQQKSKCPYLVHQGGARRNLAVLLHLHHRLHLERVLFSFYWLEILLCSVKCRQLSAIWNIERCMCGNDTRWHESNMAADPGCVKCRLSGTVCLSCVGMTISSAISKQTSLTCSRFQMLNQFCPYEVLIAS